MSKPRQRAIGYTLEALWLSPYDLLCMASASSAGGKEGDSAEPVREIDDGDGDDDSDALAEPADEPGTIAAVLGGDVDGFRVFVTRYQGRLISTLHRLVGDRHIAEELAQQSFVDAFTALERFDPQRSFAAWLFRIAINNGKDWLKSHKRSERGILGKVASDQGAFSGRLPDPERAAVSAQGLARLESALAELPVDWREVVILKDVHELSYKEIHDILDLPITTLKMRVVRGRAALRKLLDPDEGEGE